MCWKRTLKKFMNYNDLEKIVGEEVMLFKSGYEWVPFMTDIGSKDDKILNFIFNKLPFKKSTVVDRDVSIDKKHIYKIHIDDVKNILYCLKFIYQKYNDNDIKDWINDIEYHLKHYKREDPL